MGLSQLPNIQFAAVVIAMCISGNSVSLAHIVLMGYPRVRGTVRR